MGYKENKMKGKLRGVALAAALFLAPVAAVWAQIPAAVQNVLDVANLMQAVDTLYATYDHINATIEQVQNTYKQIENQIKAIQNVNFDDVANLSKIKDIQSLEDFSNFRNNIKDAVANVDANLQEFNALKSIMTERRIKVGGATFTAASLLGKGKEGEKNIFDLPKVTADYLKDQAAESIKGWATKLTAQQKATIMRKWGMSAESYGTWMAAARITNASAGLLFGYGQEAWEEMSKRIAARNAAIRTQIHDLAGESTNGKLEAVGEAVMALNHGLLDLHNVFAQVGDFMVSEYFEKAARAEAEAEAKASNEEIIKGRIDDIYQMDPRIGLDGGYADYTDGAYTKAGSRAPRVSDYYSNKSYQYGK
jgi:hypothetical protein